MENQNVQKYMQIKKIPEIGLEKELIIEDSILASKDSLVNYHSGSTAKPGTIPHRITLDVLTEVIKTNNPNGVDRTMFRGASNREKNYISMVATLFGKKQDDKELDAGFLLSGGTESINQISWMLRNKYFEEQLNKNVRVLGIDEAIFQASKEKYGLNKNFKLIKPKILMPINMHFSGLKLTDLQGIGIDKIVEYELDNNFDIDESALRKQIENIYEQGEDIMFAYASGGDTTKGKVQDINLLSNVLNEYSVKYEKQKTPLVVDAAGSFMFIGLMKNNKEYTGKMPDISFENDNVVAIIGDPHKQPIPYSSGLLMLKDMSLTKYTDLRSISNPAYLDMDDLNTRDLTAALATIPTSRSGANAFAAWAHLAHLGKTGLEHDKIKIWENVEKLKDYIIHSKDYNLVCEPQTQVVPFAHKNHLQNMNIYTNIKRNKEDFLHISYDEHMYVRTKQNKILAEKNSIYSGLFATIMEHNNPKDIDCLITRLDKEAYQIKKSEKYINNTGNLK